MRPYVRYFHSSQYLNDLASGEVCLSVGWSGGIEQARQRGAQAAAPVDAPHPENAYLFLDYLMEPEVIAGLTNAVGQANGNAASLPYVAEAVRNNPSIDPSEEVYRRHRTPPASRCTRPAMASSAAPASNETTSPS